MIEIPNLLDMNIAIRKDQNFINLFRIKFLEFYQYWNKLIQVFMDGRSGTSEENTQIILVGEY